MTGLILDRVPRRQGMIMVATAPLLIAHDLIEHPNGLHSIGDIPDELQAMGGIWFVRGWRGHVSVEGSYNAYRAAESIAHEVSRMFYEGGYDQLHPCDVTVPVTQPCEIDTSIEETNEYAREQILAEGRYRGHPHETNISRYLLLSRAMMRRGYRATARRFGSSTTALNQLEAIMAAVAPAMRDPIEGQQFLLRYGEGRAYCGEIEDEYA